MMGSIQGTHASYNVQSVVDDKHGLITHTDVVSDVNDKNQFASQIIQAEQVTGKECEISCGDAGYAYTKELEKIDRRGTKVIVPSQRQALHNPEEKPFSKDKFIYDKDQDCYCCPEGHKLVYAGIHEPGRSIAYRINDANICKQCSNSLTNVPMLKAEERLSDYCKKRSKKSLSGNTSSQSHRISINGESRVLNIRLVILRGTLG